jgi:LmbE family N-acetylglucosaminyl deacetylase
MLDILIVSPHPDDAELGMAGAILKFRAEGLAVGILDLTNGEPTPFGTPEIRQRETAAATEILGIDWRENLGLPKTDMPHEPHWPERIFYYYCVHLRIIPQPAFVLDISEQWEKKRAAIECYRSQFIEGRPQEPPTFVDQLRDQAATWGWSIGVRYGEPFASREPVGLSTLKGLI